MGEREQSVYEQACWQGPMWNGCGCCNWTRRSTGRQVYCAWCCREVEVALSCLARNLRDAAGLCLAHRLGYQRGIDDENSFHRGMDNRDLWRPGCGEQAPGWPADDKRGEP